MPLGIEVDLSPGDFVLDGDPAPPQKGAETPIFGPRLLWPNSCVDQDAMALILRYFTEFGSFRGTLRKSG